MRGCSTSGGRARSRRASVEAELKGRRIESVGRRGKYLIVGLEGDRFLVMHLRMTGNLLAGGRGAVRRAAAV